MGRLSSKNKFNFGFTLIELLVVIAIIGLLSSVVLISLSSARARARDTRRLSDVSTLQKALELYYNAFGQYPTGGGGPCGGWDSPNDGNFIGALRTAGFMPQDLKDPKGDSDCTNYLYYRYSAGDYGCDASRGNYYLLMVIDMESSGRPYPGSPGFSCTGRNWGAEGDYVIGKFEK